MPTEQSNLTDYSDIFNRHVEETRRHIQGAITPAAPIEVSVVGSSQWTPAELDAFFHALTIHSRLRPDLISASVKSKHVLEVVELLNLLEEGSKSHEHPPSVKFQTPGAYEMSKVWITWEEKQAELLQAQENSSNSCYMASERANPKSRTVLPAAITEEEGVSPRQLSPISRRRHQKRLCMRRKRAMGRGEEAETTVGLLRKGRRCKARGVSKTPLKTCLPSGPNTVPDVPSTSAQTHLRSSESFRGQRPPKSDHPTVDEPTIPDTDNPSSTFIHKSNLRNFLRFYIGLYDKKSLNGHEDIHDDTIDLLSRMIRDFISKVIGSAVTLLEEQIEMKRYIKVWRQKDPENGNFIIKTSVIHRSLESMGFAMKTRKRYIQDLLASFDQQVGSDCNGFHGRQHRTAQDKCIFLPQAFQHDSECLDAALLIGRDDEEAAEHEFLLDQEDSVADWAHEIGLWNQVTAPSESMDRLTNNSSPRL